MKILLKAAREARNSIVKYMNLKIEWYIYDFGPFFLNRQLKIASVWCWAKFMITLPFPYNLHCVHIRMFQKKYPLCSSQ